MIRINLLPVRAAKKKESARFQVTVAGMITFFVFALSMAAYLSVRNEAQGLADQLARDQQELGELKKKIGELSRIKEQKRIVEEKLKIINDLEAARTGPSKLFKKVSEAIPDKAWLVSMAEDGRGVSVKGYATTDEVVADFMRNLQKYDDYTVELEVVRTEAEKETGMEMVNFSMRLDRKKEAAPQAAKKEAK